MKQVNFLLLFLGILSFNSCKDKVDETITYKINEPVFLAADQFRSSVKVTNVPVPITKQGKICFYQGYLFISEPEKGIHIVDNRNPSSPSSVGFIELMGNADLAIKDNLLYADSYIDLVWFDISNPSKPVLKGRKENVFPSALPATNNQYVYDYAMCSDKTKGVIVGWVVAERTDSYPYYSEWGGGIMFDGVNSGLNNAGTKSLGLNGSMSRFAIYKNFLYTVLNNQLGIFNIEADAPAQMGENFYVGWNVETIFSYKDCMFMGTPTGMLIYSVADPVKPVFQSSLQHFYGCDPVVVENDKAYITVRSGNNCGQNSNELFVVDVSDVKKPKQLVSYSMTSPKGLGIDNGILFLCDDGLKVYDATDPMIMMSKKLAHYQGMDGYDVIPFNNTLMMIASDGIYQYDYSNLNNIKQLSKLSIGQ